MAYETHDLHMTPEQVRQLLKPARINLKCGEQPSQTLTDADTYYRLVAALTDGNAVGFVQRGDPYFDLMFTGLDNTVVQIHGMARMAITGSAADLTMNMFINGAESKIFDVEPFTAIPSVEGIEAIGFVVVNYGATFQPRVKCSDAGRELTCHDIKLTMKSFAIQE